jgi:hypothetical protein
MKLIKRAAQLAGTSSIPFLLMAIAINFSACKKEEANKPAPIVTVNPTTVSNTPGSTVATSVLVESPEGGQTLAILVNGQSNSSLPNVTLDGSASQTVPVNFVIPANATIGATYLISFQATDKKNQFSQIGTFNISVSSVASKQIVEVSGNITTNTTWTNDKIYRLNGFVRVGTDVITAPATSPAVTATATLTIQEGTVIYGKTGTPGGTLIVQRGSKIIAIGTAAKPIIFTSEKAINLKRSGDWGGVVICGKADINATATGFVTHTNELEGGYGGYYGGGSSPDNADNSGTLKYVRIEWAGYPINPNQEINGLTLGGVGSGTTISYIQSTYANDDSFEFFGGTVNADHLIAYKGIDDDFDTDNGYSGKVQFGLAIRDAIISDQSGSNGFECDNDGTGSANTPFTSAVFSNITIIGPKATSGSTIGIQFQNAAQLRRNSKQSIINSFFTAFPTGIFIDNSAGSPGTISNYATGAASLKNNVLAGVPNWGGNGFGTASNADERTITGIPYTVSNGATPPSNGDFNHPAPPRGRMVSGGNIPSGSNPFVNGVFTVNEVTNFDPPTNSLNAFNWFVGQGNVIKSSFADATVGLNANVFEPLNGTPTLLPGAGSILLTGASFSGFTGFDTTPTYRGAFGATDWTTGWVNWTPLITDYSH